MAFKEIALLLTICVFGAEAELSWNNCGNFEKREFYKYKAKLSGDRDTE